MSVNLSSSGVFLDITTDGTDLTIPLASIRYGTGTLADEGGDVIATGDYRGLMRGIQESYHYFMTGVATGTSNPDNFNEPSFFGEEAGGYQVYQTDYLRRTYRTDLYYNIMENSTLPDES